MRFLRVGTELKEGNYVRNLGRSVLSDSSKTLLTTSMAARLNAPFGARCFLTKPCRSPKRCSSTSLNAPYGALCFLTLQARDRIVGSHRRLNAPFGARCFLTHLY